MRPLPLKLRKQKIDENVSLATSLDDSERDELIHKALSDAQKQKQRGDRLQKENRSLKKKQDKLQKDVENGNRRAERKERDDKKAAVVAGTELVTDNEALGAMTGVQMNAQIDKLRAIWGKKLKLPSKSLRVLERKAALRKAVEEHLKLVAERGGVVPGMEKPTTEPMAVDWHEEEDAEMEDA
ncbi:hypothetical protein HMN09_01254800 [Mycena chlorophos]|uniref:Uncharacterized protein n=1 Tax=Mycena chlorophos TaxID=658473 RepID=A0A8H6S2N9_MYCCL|nr:hypothetical protein HMN09_01254800 [Mycena chlorophos]